MRRYLRNNCLLLRRASGLRCVCWCCFVSFLCGDVTPNVSAIIQFSNLCYVEMFKIPSGRVFDVHHLHGFPITDFMWACAVTWEQTVFFARQIIQIFRSFFVIVETTSPLTTESFELSVEFEDAFVEFQIRRILQQSLPVFLSRLLCVWYCGRCDCMFWSRKLTQWGFAIVLWPFQTTDWGFLCYHSVYPHGVV